MAKLPQSPLSAPMEVEGAREFKISTAVVMRVKKKLGKYSESKMNKGKKWPTLCQLVLQQSLKKTNEHYISEEESAQYIASISKQADVYSSMVFKAMREVRLKKHDSFKGLDARFLNVSYNNLALLKQLIAPLFKADKFKSLKAGTYSGASFLHVASQEGCVDIAQWLMGEGENM